MAYKVKKGKATKQKREKKETFLKAGEALAYLMKAGLSEDEAKRAIYKVMRDGNPATDYRLTDPETGERVYPVGPDPFGFGPKPN
jgi:hypothetical protein